MRITRPQGVSTAYALRFLGIETTIAGLIFCRLVQTNFGYALRHGVAISTYIKDAWSLPPWQKTSRVF
jgi:hypothetical protein